MIGNIIRDGKGEIIDDSISVSLFQPSDAVKEITAAVRDDYSVGNTNLHRPFEEFNDRSLIQIMNDNQRIFNAYVPPRDQDPDNSWRAQTVRPLTRNKIISIAAHVTVSILVPDVFAQNDQDDEDKEAANVMKDLIEWTINNSDYEETFLFAVISGLVNPVMILEAEYAEVMQRVKVKLDNGEIAFRQVLDEVLSGFQANVVPPNELLIANFYEYSLQRQRFIIRRRFISYDEARERWGSHKNFEFVRPGVRVFFSDQEGMFYDERDDSLPDEVEEVVYYNRTEDTEIPFVNGIYHGDDNTEANMIKHRDANGNPKYKFAKSGYEPIDEKHFFYYKSSVSKLGPEQEVVDTLWNMIIDGSFLDQMPPISIFGEEEVDSGVIFPGVTNVFSKDTRLEPMQRGSSNSATNALAMVERSMAEGSIDATQAGIPLPKQATAFELSQNQENARIQLGLFGKMIATLVVDYGNLMIDDILNHMTVGQVEEITAGVTRMKFRRFLLPDKTENGRKVTRKIEFTDELFGLEQTEEEKDEASFKIAEEQGGLRSGSRLIKVNPALFRRLKFMLIVVADAMLPKNEFLQKALKLQAYDRMIANPFVDQRAVTEDFLVETFADGDVDKYMKDEGQTLPMGPEGAEEGQIETPPKSALIESLVNNQSTAS